MPPTGPIPVLYHDEHLVVVDKPGGLLVHRAPRATDRVVLLQLLRDQLGKHLYPVHRLDRPTSGVIAFAFSSEVARDLHDALKLPETRKEYLVLCRGSTPDLWESERPLSGKPARTEFRKLAEWSRCTLLRARLHTGRRHQIRRHLAHAAHQPIGDTNYGKGRINTFFRETYALPRLVLHAARLSVQHPVTGAPLDITAPLADDLRAFLLRLPDVDPDLVATL